MSATSDGSTNNTPSPPTPKFLWHNILQASGLSLSGITSPFDSSIIGKSFPIPCIFENFNPFKSSMISLILNDQELFAAHINLQMIVFHVLFGIFHQLPIFLMPMVLSCSLKTL